MNRRFAFASLALRFAAPLLIASAAPAPAYEAPDFASELFSADGIFLAPEERSALIEALVARASNFPDHQRIDDGLREKALALALRLAPLDPGARAAHRDLLAGARPRASPSFDDPGEVSETLWNLGQRLLGTPLDPEEGRLAPFLLELSLLAHPQPPDERLVEFAARCDGKAPVWGAVSTPENDAHPSTTRARDLFGLARSLLAASEEAAKRPAAAPPGPDPEPAPRPEPAPMASEPTVEALVASLATVRMVEFADPAAPTDPEAVAGTAVLTIRAPRGRDERELLVARGEGAAFFPLVSSREGIPMENPELPETAAAGRSWMWPEGRVGEVRFDAASPLPGPLRFLRTSAALPVLILMESALGSKPVNGDFVLLGDLDPVSMQAGLGDAPVSLVEKGAMFGRPYLLAPETLLEPLVEFLQRSDRVEMLFGSELVSYADPADAVSRMTSPTDPALLAASAAFDEIEAASARLPLPELARNPSAQERLRNLIAAFPRHLSARAMLEYGTRPVSEEIRVRQFADKLHEIAAPFLVLEDAADPYFERPLADLFSESDTQFLRMRSETLPQARNLLGSAEDLVAAAKLYLQITNRDTSIANQRLRETRAAIEAYRGERRRLGLSDDAP